MKECCKWLFSGSRLDINFEGRAGLRSRRLMMPATLPSRHLMVQARIDSLPPALRTVLKLGSILDVPFDLETLAALGEDEVDEHLEGHVAALAFAGLLIADGNTWKVWRHASSTAILQRLDCTRGGGAKIDL